MVAGRFFLWFQAGISWFFMVFHGSNRFSRLFMVPGWFLMGVHGCRSFFFMVPGWYFMVFHGFSWLQSVFTAFHGSRLVFNGCSWLQVVFFYGSRLVFHGF